MRETKSLGLNCLIMVCTVLQVLVHQLPLHSPQLAGVADIEPQHKQKVGGQKPQHPDITVRVVPEDCGFLLPEQQQAEDVGFLCLALKAAHLGDFFVVQDAGGAFHVGQAGRGHAVEDRGPVAVVGGDIFLLLQNFLETGPVIDCPEAEDIREHLLRQKGFPIKGDAHDWTA